MKCNICNGLGILPGLTKNTKCSYCDWGDVPDEDLQDLENKASLYDKFLKEANELGYSGIGDMLDSAKEWRKIAETQALNTLDLQEKLKRVVQRIGTQDHYIGDKIHYGAAEEDDYRCYHMRLYIPTPAKSPKSFDKALQDWLGIYLP
jgi:hypothetical protein